MGEGSNIKSVITLSYSLHFLIVGGRKYEWQTVCKEVHTATRKEENL